MKKQFLSLGLSLLVLIPSTVSFANDYSHFTNLEKVSTITESSSTLIEDLKELGFNDSEIQELINREINEICRRSSFPSNPKYGERCTMDYSISNLELGLPGLVAAGTHMTLTSSQITKALVEKYGLGALSWAALATGQIISYVNAEKGFKGFDIEVEYTYGPDNHLSVSWTPGYCSVRSYK